MSRQRFQRYSLLFLSVNAILICGSSRRIPRRASCPSCSQDCPEALTVQLPWYSYQESNPQPQDFSVNPFKHYDSRLMREGISQDILSNPDSMAFGNYIYPQQESANENLFFRNVPNKLPGSLTRQEVFPRNEPASEYPFAHVSPRSFDRSDSNLIFRSPRDKFAESSPKNRNFQDKKQDLASKVFASYRADRDTTLSDDLRDIFPNIYPQGLSRPEHPSLPRQETVLEERNLMKTPNSVDRPYKFANEAYYPEQSEIKHNLPFLPQSFNVQKIMEDERVFNNLDKDSLQSWNLGQLEQAEKNFLEMYPARDEQTILTEADGQINRNPDLKLILPQDFNIWKSMKDGKSYDDWDFIPRNRPQESAEIRQWQEENNWPQLYVPSNDITLFAEENQDKGYTEEDVNQRYFKDEIDKDTVQIEKDNYNPYHSSENMDIWGETRHEEFFDNLGFMFEHPQDNQKKKQELELYPQDNKYFQGKGYEGVPFNHEARDETDEVTRKLADPSFISRLLNIFNNRKHSVQSSESSQESTGYNALRKDSVDDRNARFFDNTAMQDTQDLILPKDVHGIKEYSEHNIPLIDVWQNIKDVRNKPSREIDPDLFDDIENPPTESTESPTESHVEFSTSQK